MNRNNLTKICGGILLLFCFSATAQKVTYHGHIAPIIHEHCAGCHSKDEIAPMELRSYKDVASYGQMVQFVTKTRYMPPWQPTHPIGGLKNERRLTEQEIQLIEEWVNTGMAEGEPVPKIKSPSQKATIEKPDAIVAMSETFEQYGVYYDQFKVFVLPTDFAEDKEISAIEFVPGDKTIVRGAMISIDTTDRMKPFDEWDPTLGYFSFGDLGFEATEGRWYDWFPGQEATFFPNGYGKVIPKGAKILLHIHYGPTSVAKKDSSFLKLKFADKPLKKRLQVTPFLNKENISNPSFEILANDSLRVHARYEVPFDMEIHRVIPHCHLLGRRWEIFTVSPDRQSDVLLKIDDWNFKFKQGYSFKNPKVLKKGTQIHAIAFYDNTEKNLSNPSDPPRPMKWGKRMFEEMFKVYFEWSL